jgi:tRNA pseudouridine38-40 synthase
VPRFKLTIEYAGTRYSGWQIQKNATTIQGEIDRAVRTITGRKDFELYGSGRTDAGVHALAQVAHLDVSTSLPPDTLRLRMNEELPVDINILSAVVVPHRFHARHHAVSRRYLYQISRRRTAFAKAFVWWVKDPLDVERMRLGAQAFVGMRDFRSFAQADDPDDAPAKVRPTAFARAGAIGPSRSPGPVKPGAAETGSTLVLIERLDVIEDGDLILVGIEGTHFLWKMVRRIVGVLVEIGRGGLEPDAAAQFLTAESATPARLTAPPSGLFLERVRYEHDDPSPHPLRAVTRIES